MEYCMENSMVRFVDLDMDMERILYLILVE